MFSICL